jgi:hypothetical protein
MSDRIEAQGAAAAAPPPPSVRLCLGVTGHRGSHPAIVAHRDAIAQRLAALFEIIDRAAAAEPVKAGLEQRAPTRLHSLLVDGVDQMAARQALARGWDLVAPLPFGRALNTAINTGPADAAEARVLLTGQGVCGEATRERAAAIASLQDQARLFELADQDETLTRLFLASLEAPDDMASVQAFRARASDQAALAGRIMIEQSDLVIGVWDGENLAQPGGAGHTLAMALEMGAPVIWIDAHAPKRWTILSSPESLAAAAAGAPWREGHEEALEALVHRALRPRRGRAGEAGPEASEALHGHEALRREVWRPASAPFWHAYRRVEAIFGATRWKDAFTNLTQAYESPLALSSDVSSGGQERLGGLPPAFLKQVREEVQRRFAWADGVSARLSDAYRGGMILNFIFSALAVLSGLAYLPFARHEDKWLFALVELGLLLAILAITSVGQRRDWHRRWFETRRVAEYFRHAPILLLLGVCRPTGRWPRGAETNWPEWYARHALRDVGLPPTAVTPAYLRRAAEDLLLAHVTAQRDYHRGKAERLARAHANLDRLSGRLFSLAVLSVSLYLSLKAGAASGLVRASLAESSGPLFTFLGVALPTLGGALAGIRYFGDFERFSAISEVTAEKLDLVAARLRLLLQGPDEALTYARVSSLAHAADAIVVDEIENWQAVFGGKTISVPV